MHFQRARLLQKFYDIGDRRAAHNRVVHHYNALALHVAFEHVQFEGDAALALGLRRLDKRPANISVLDQAQPEGDSAFHAVTYRAGKSAVGYADDKVGVHGVLLCQKLTREHARFVDRLSVDDTVGTREVDMLEYAGRRLFRAETLVGRKLSVVQGDYLARLDVAHKLRADGVERARFGSKDVIFAYPAHAQGAYAERVAHGYQLGGAHNQKREGTFQLGHDLRDSFFHAGAVDTRLCYEVCDNLRVVGGVEQRARIFQLFAQLVRVEDIAVVGNSQRTFHVGDEKRLGVFTRVASYGGIAHVAYRNVAGHCGEIRVGKYVGYKSQILLAGGNPVLVHGYAAGFLTAVLEGEKPVVNGFGNVWSVLRGIVTEHAAFFFKCHKSVLPKKQ